MFETVSLAPADPILGLSEAFVRDPNPAKINLSVGVYKDAAGKTPVLASVKKAERRLLDEEATKNYLGIDGAPEFARGVQELLFGPGHEVLTAKRSATSHTPGGTAALRVAADFLHQQLPNAKVWLSQPTWPNHPSIFRAAGVETSTYPYFDPATNEIAWQPLLAALEQIPAGDVVLLHGCCQNPTGLDPSPAQWRELAAVVRRRGLLPLIDFAYQGFGVGLREDAAAIEAFATAGGELMVCSSFSKNFGLYRERVGALTIVAANAAAAETVQSQVKAAIRANYSNPPAHGAAVAALILGDPALRAEWEQELRAMRNRIQQMRKLFVETLAAKGVPGDYSFITRQRGMFSFSGLSPEQVKTLRDKHALYIVGSGRINVAGMTEANMGALCEAIKAVV